MKTDVHLLSYVAQFFLQKEMLSTKFLEKIEVQFYVRKSFSENRSLYEIMWNTAVQPDGPQVAAQYDAFALAAG